MSGVLLKANSGEVSLTAATAKTALQIVAASNHRVKVTGFAIFFKGTSATDTPVKYRILRQTTAGTMTAGTAGTHLSKNNDADDETVQTTVQHTATAEPTAGDVLEFGEIHPQTGARWFYPLGQEIIIKGGGRVGVELTAAQGQTVVVTADLDE
jgi:hypothetical protein